MPYLWTDSDQINKFMRGRQQIKVGAVIGENDVNFDELTAQEFENEAVSDITIELSPVFAKPPDKDDNNGVGATATATISNGGMVTSIAVDNMGSGYDNIPAIVITGGGGECATAVATISDSGEVQSISVTSGGKDYSSVPTVTIVGRAPNPMLARMAAKLTAAKIGTVWVGSAEGWIPNWSLWYYNDVFASLFRLMLSVDYIVNKDRSGNIDTDVVITGGGGGGAIGEVSIENGEVESITVIDGGQNYTSEPVVTIDSPPVNGTTATADAVIATDGENEGQVIAFTITDSGSGYPVTSNSLIPSPLSGLSFRPDYAGAGLSDMLILAKPRFTFIDRDNVNNT